MQLYWVLRYGTFLAQRRDGRNGINLYYCEDEERGSFTEVGVDDGRGQAVVLHRFVSNGSLDVYAHGVRLPGR